MGATLVDALMKGEALEEDDEAEEGRGEEEASHVLYFMIAPASFF